MTKVENGWRKTLMVIGYGWICWVSVTLISTMVFMGRGTRFTERDGYLLETKITELKTQILLLELKLEHHNADQDAHKP